MYLNNQIVLEDMQYIYKQKISWERLKNKRIFISGSYGMLSSYIVFFLMFLNIYHDYNIHVIAQGRNKKKAKERFFEFWSHQCFEYTDINICEKISNNFHADYYIHAAGIANPKYYSKFPVEVIEPNVLGTYHLLQLARKNSCQKFLLFSSGDIYGLVNNPSCITEDSLGTMDTLDIHSCYGESKRLAETLCSSFSKEYNIPITIARIGHTYGPTMDIFNDPRSFSSFMKCAIKGEDIVMFSDGKSKRPFCYLADAVYGFMLMLLEGEDNGAYNISNSKQFISIFELANTVAEICNDSIKVIKQIRTDSYVENTLNMCNRLSEEKLIKLGWNCEYNVKTGMERTYNFLAPLYK